MPRRTKESAKIVQPTPYEASGPRPRIMQAKYDPYDPLRQSYSASSVKDLVEQVEKRQRVYTKKEIMNEIDNCFFGSGMDLYQQYYHFVKTGDDSISAWLQLESDDDTDDEVSDSENEGSSPKPVKERFINPRETLEYESFVLYMNSYDWGKFGWCTGIDRDTNKIYQRSALDDDGKIRLFKIPCNDK